MGLGKGLESKVWGRGAWRRFSETEDEPLAALRAKSFRAQLRENAYYRWGSPFSQGEIDAKFLASCIAS